MKTKDKIFGVLQRVGRSFMLPIAILPVAGLLLGIGSSFTNETTLETYGLTGVIYQGSLLYTVLDVMSRAGSAVFDNLALLFAMGVAIGMAKKEKEVAALSGAVAFLVMHTTISALINAKGGAEAMLENSTGSVLGITTLQMGVFGGIIVGLGVAALHNRFYKIELPQVLSFFGGTRFVPIISSLTYVLVGVLMFFIWPVIQGWIYTLGDLVLSSGYAGTWIYGIIERALIPFGLHHVFYMPFWQTGLGGSAVIDGVVVEGAQNIYFAELASKSTTHFSVSATRFMAGKFPFMIFGLPGAALAMYRCARPEKKKAAGGLLLSASLTAMITGITEPLEFTFIFVAPLMYAVHCVLAGLSFMLMHIFNVGVGMTFSGGLIDLTLFGILQGNEKTNWIYIVLVGIVYFFLYYFIFGFMIRKFNYVTPGRETDDVETKLYTRSDVDARKKAVNGNDNNTPSADPISASIMAGLGGKPNILDLDCCATRLRITVADPSLVNEDVLKSSGASGVMKKGNGIQVIYGPKVSVVKSRLEDFLESSESDIDTVPAGTELADKDDNYPEGGEKTSERKLVLYSPIKGKIIPLEEVKDEVFSTGILGRGIAIEPEQGKVFAPCDGVISSIPETNHAVGITAENGMEVLIHVGMDTVKLKGKHFKRITEVGKAVKTGDLLLTFDLTAIKGAGYSVTTPMVIADSDNLNLTTAEGHVNPGKALLEARG